MRFVGVMFVALLMGACTVPPEQRSRDVCTAFCNCFTVGTSAVANCIEQCIPDIPNVADDCLTCVYENSQQCSVLERDCNDLCAPQQTPRLGGMQ
jgi:hypothetical protein